MKGGKHAAAGFPFIGDNAVGDFDTRLGTVGIASSRASWQRYAQRRLHTGFLRHMGPSLSYRL